MEDSSVAHCLVVQQLGPVGERGLMLGNTPLEFLSFAGDTITKTSFAGIALEPAIRIHDLMRLYDSPGISYGDP